jgi:spermidine synthase
VKVLRKLVRPRAASVEVSESKGVRTLHLGGEAIQSAMRLSDPDALELDYTQAMMACALFTPAPRDVAMIGLGAGSLAKFVHRHFPQTGVVAVEISPKVVAAARSFFDLPREGERFRIVVADGAAYVPAHAASADLLMVDGFEDGKVVTSLCTQSFYDAAFAMLRPGGTMVANFMAEEPRFGTYLARIERAFGGRVLLLPAADKVNMIAFGIKGGPSRYAIDGLREQARALRRRLGLPYEAFVRDLLDTNARTASYLRCGRPVPGDGGGSRG